LIATTRQAQALAALSMHMLLLLACQRQELPASGIATDVESPREVSGATPTQHSAHAEPATYLLLGRDSAPYLYRLVRIPSSCLVEALGCSSPEVIDAFPAEGITPSHLFWSPFNELAIILDTYGQRVLLLDPASGELKTLFTGIATISDELVWLDDGKAMLVVQGSDAYSSDVVGLSMLEGTPKMESVFQFEGLAHLLGTLANGHLLVRVDIYGVTDPSRPGKETLVEIQLVEVDPTTGTVRRYLPGIDWTSNTPSLVLSDGFHLLGSTAGRTLLWDARSAVSEDLGPTVTWPTGSPDGKSVAYIKQSADGGGFSLTLLSLDDGQSSELVGLPVSPRPFWSPDSRLIVLGQFALDASADLGSLRVVDVDTGNVAIPNIAFGDYPVVLDVSWGP